MEKQHTTETLINVYIEIEKGSNLKYEFNKQTNQLELDRVLSGPHVYPYAYGFIPNTLAEDGDELDVLVVCDVPNYRIQNDTYIDVYIVGALLMEDEHGNDHKILAVPNYESGDIQSLYDIPADRLESIQTFFSNCEKNEPDKWSIVHGFVGKPAAIKIYQTSILPHKITDEVSSSYIAAEAESSAKTVELSAHT
jgi:inorganic pyrophosphatase